MPGLDDGSLLVCGARARARHWNGGRTCLRGLQDIYYIDRDTAYERKHCYVRMFDNVPMRTVTQYDLIEMTFSIDCHWFSQDHSWESNLLPAAPVCYQQRPSFTVNCAEPTEVLAWYVYAYESSRLVCS